MRNIGVYIFHPKTPRIILDMSKSTSYSKVRRWYLILVSFSLESVEFTRKLKILDQLFGGPLYRVKCKPSRLMLFGGYKYKRILEESKLMLFEGYKYIREYWKSPNLCYLGVEV